MESGTSQAAPLTPAPLRKHDVFLSFYGKDTRKGFSDHLYTALKNEGIFVFRDNEELKRGENISELLKAIQESEYAVVVISENYAFSKWCLKELTEIVKSKREHRLTILPIFYHVNPSNVRNQKESFADGLATHVKECEEDRVKWRSALEEVGDVAGWHVQDSYESKVVQEVCKEIFVGLNPRLSINFKDVVGIESQVKEMMTLMRARGTRGTAKDIHFIGICGMGGIGKTTLAQVIFDNISSEFEATCFVEDVREKLEKIDIVCLQEQIIHEILGDKDIKIWSSFGGTRLMANRFQGKKILLVLDNVDKASQIEVLANSPDWFGQGSRVLLISRNKQLLKVFVEEIYKVKGLSGNDALRTFCLKAFKKNHPVKKYENLSKEFVNYAHGLPLALKVFGSHLFKKELLVWESTLKQWKEEPPIEIWEKLKISFDGLLDLQKELFLDIACFFNREPIHDVMQYLEGVGYYPNSNIEVLQDKSLIKVSSGIFKMHDLLQDMGRRIVRKKSLKNPGECSRLWCSEDIVHVLKNNIGTEAIEGIFLRLPLRKPTNLNFEGFSKMKRLKMLVIRLNDFYNTSSDKAFEHYPEWYGNPSEFMLSNELRILEWWGYPLECLPTNFEPNNLIKLKMPMSNIKQLWNGKKDFEKLEHIDLSDSQNLVEMPEFGGVSNLEELNVKGVGIKQLSSSVILPKKLKVLHIGGTSSKPISLVPHDFFIHLKFLRKLDLSNCNLTDGVLPNDLGCLSSLRDLDLSRNKFTKIDCVSKLSSLVNLRLNNCDMLKALPPRFSSPLYTIRLEKCSSLNTFSEPRDILTSSENLVAGDMTLRGFYFGHDGKYYCTINFVHILVRHLRHLGSLTFYYFATVAWGPTLSSNIPKWFTGLHDISGMFQRCFEVEKDGEWDDILGEYVFDYWGYALFIVYETFESDSCQKKGEIHEVEVDEYGNSSSTISPVFVCELEVQGVTDGKVPRKYWRTRGKVRIAFRVPDIPSVGRNGVWVFIGADCFLKAGLEVCGDLGLCSISISSPNVEVKECGGRLVLNHELSECHDIIKSISPHDLDSEIAQLAFKRIYFQITSSSRGRGNKRKDGKNCPSLTSFFDPRYLLVSVETLMARDIPVEAFYFGYDGKRYRTYHLAHSLINEWDTWYDSTSDLLLGRNFATITWGPPLTSDIPEWFTSLSYISGIFQQRFEAERRVRVPGWSAPRSHHFREFEKLRIRYLLEFPEANLYYEVVDDAVLSQLFDPYYKFEVVCCWGYALFIVYEFLELNSCQKKEEIHEVDEYGNSSSTMFPVFVCELEVQEIKDPNEEEWTTFEKFPGEYCRTLGKVPIVFRVPDIPSVGRNGVWVFIKGECFESAGLKCCDPRGLCSISINSPNVDVKECRGRLVLKHDRSECYEIIKSISPHGLGSETLTDIFYGGGFTVFGDIIPREKRKEGKEQKGVGIYEEGEREGVEIQEEREEEKGEICEEVEKEGVDIFEEGEEEGVEIREKGEEVLKERKRKEVGVEICEEGERVLKERKRKKVGVEICEKGKQVLKERKRKKVGVEICEKGEEVLKESNRNKVLKFMKKGKGKGKKVQKSVTKGKKNVLKSVKEGKRKKMLKFPIYRSFFLFYKLVKSKSEFSTNGS